MAVDIITPTLEKSRPDPRREHEMAKESPPAKRRGRPPKPNRPKARRRVIRVTRQSKQRLETIVDLIGAVSLTQAIRQAFHLLTDLHKKAVIDGGEIIVRIPNQEDQIYCELVELMSLSGSSEPSIVKRGRPSETAEDVHYDEEINLTLEPASDAHLMALQSQLNTTSTAVAVRLAIAVLDRVLKVQERGGHLLVRDPRTDRLEGVSRLII